MSLKLRAKRFFLCGTKKIESSYLNVLKLLWTTAKLGRSLSVMCPPLACYNVGSESCKARSPCYKVSNHLGHVETKMERCFRPSNHIRCLLPFNGYVHAHLASLRISCSLRSPPSSRAVAPWSGCFGEKNTVSKRDVNTFETWHFDRVGPKST